MKNPTHICEDCLTQGVPKSNTRGSIWLEIILWLLCFPIGIIYSLWRLSTRTKGCPVCGGKMIPLTTLKGRQLAQQQ